MIDEKQLIKWLLGKKYIAVNENSTEMTEEFEAKHKWELSRNSFINKTIDYINAQPKILSPNYFQQKSLETVDSSNSMLFLQGILGLNGEAGEVNAALLEYYTSMLDTIKDNLKMWREASKTSDDLKKYLFQGHELEKKNVALELGDVMWYVAITAHVMGYTLEEIMQMNIEKREVRYGGEFSIEKSVNRKE